MADKEKIKAEIERQIELNNNIDPITTAQQLVVNSVNVVLTELHSFIDSLPEEPVSKQKLSNVQRNVKNLKEPVREDLPHIRHRDTLDEFAYQCAYDLSNDWAKETPEWKDVKTACKLGAQWQKEKFMDKACNWLWRTMFDDNSSMVLIE